jgi:hypothetical protein
MKEEGGPDRSLLGRDFSHFSEGIWSVGNEGLRVGIVEEAVSPSGLFGAG